MDPYLIALIVLVVLFVVSVRKAGEASRRRKKAWAAYYEAPRLKRR